MKLIRLSLVMLLGMSLGACQSKPSAEMTNYPSDSSAHIATKPETVAELERQVLSLHDSVMPAMSELINLKKQVNQRLMKFRQQPTSAVVNQQTEQAQAINDALAKADQSMMNWMHQYNGDTLAKLDEQRALAYLKEEQQRVNAMSQLMRKSITDAQAYLKTR